MADKDSELRVVRQSRDGRRRYDVDGKRALVEAALRPGVSVARLAQEHGINANLLRKWITKYLLEREGGTRSDSQKNGAAESAISHTIEMIEGVPIDIPGMSMRKPASESPQSAFATVVPASTSVAGAPASLPSTPSMAVSLHVRLLNGVEFDLGEASLEELSVIVQMLVRL